tara:strand:- start:845 stop:1171 length:327 start_codon:yes stop_codon:yes gene_type:complete
MKIGSQRLREIIREEVGAEADALKGFGTKTATKSAQTKAVYDRSKAIAKGDTLGGVDNRERAILMQIEKVLISIAEKDDLIKYRPTLEAVLKRLLAAAAKSSKKAAQK